MTGAKTLPDCIVLGAGGHAAVVIDAITESGQARPAGILDADPARAGDSVLGVPVIGDDGALGTMAARGITLFVVGVGSIDTAHRRAELFDMAAAQGLSPLSVRHPSAWVSSSAEMGPGTVVLAGAVVNTAAELGRNVIVNSGAVVEHHCVIGDHAHVATGACMGGDVTIGAGAHIGAGATIRQGIRIGAGALVGAGAVVVQDVPEGARAIGVPARIDATSKVQS